MAHKHHQHDTKNISTAFFLNLAFTIIEIIGGLMTNSVAVMSDALHDLGIVCRWVWLGISKK